MHPGRRLAVVAVVAVAIIASAFVGVRYLRALDMRSSDPTSAKVAATEELVCYELTTERPLRVRVRPPDTEYRVISHLLVPTADASAPAEEYLYGISARILDADGGVIQEATYWTRTRATKVAQPGGPGWESAFFYPPRDVMPTDGRTSTVLIPAASKPASLELSLVSDGGATGAVRLYRRAERDAKSHRGAWRRLRKAERADLARHNVYDPSMLTADDKRALTKFAWERTAADG
ncbi:hypothetical protein HN766_17335, partial [Candidatus Poribacteria bacterium]|nr:hypothetical protein [Candidatus Poribacteria bacterium]